MSHAMVMTEFGAPDVLEWQEVPAPEPGPGEVVIRVKAAGVGPTDLHIRAGHLAAVFPQRAGDVLGFEAAGVVEAVGIGADAAVGDEVAALLADQGGYGELVRTSVWHPKPPSVSWIDAAALPASAEAAVGTLLQSHAARGETLVVLGAAGSVGSIIVQLARANGVRVVGAARQRDAELVRELGGEFVKHDDNVFDRVARRVDAVIDAAGRGGLTAAVAAVGDPSRVVTLTGGPEVASSGALMSHPGPDRAPGALAVTVPMLAAGTLRLKRRRVVPITEAAQAHRLLESGETHDKLVLTFD
ncbi:quinone oxidoreductase family protein [Aeromicrobium fastidiosum]|uniref:NADP-dependent oxidoreductase n=1 Tax=Aeromicrobium fastidiosum TaxID=52699 RepID=A0A641ANX9_9ACTN|nr:NADP-dependent oxidoreductase [Aeromicrobium fastidiosum]KAA1376349.1 NADP-dependent oxidoreductase [Aeromicrobium fastidiosum]MBP2391751.1 NADPH:quinone reductase-like Zn-dependent oxidoreductase [Aeromicrobium fastidiosum]